MSSELHKTINAYHESAMLLVAESDRLRLQAFRRERYAALMADIEPSRSILLRSAAQLAYDCGEFKEAERLIANALRGNPPEEVARELNELRATVEAARNRDQA